MKRCVSCLALLVVTSMLPQRVSALRPEFSVDETKAKDPPTDGDQSQQTPNPLATGNTEDGNNGMTGGVDQTTPDTLTPPSNDGTNTGANQAATSAETQPASTPKTNSKPIATWTQANLMDKIKEPAVMEILPGSTFARFKLNNCAGRWIADSGDTKLAVGGDPNKEPDCGVLKASKEEKECGSFATQEEYDKATADKDHPCNKDKFFRIQNQDWTDNWVKDPKKTEVKCESLSHYVNKEPYTMLLPLKNVIGKEIACIRPDRRENVKKEIDYGACKGFGGKNIKITEDMVIVRGSHPDADNSPMYLSEVRPKYVDCAENKEEVESWLNMARTGAAGAAGGDDDDDGSAVCGPTLVTLFAVLVSVLHRP